MSSKLYEYKEILWEYHTAGFNEWVIPFCPVHRMELNSASDTYFGHCEDCGKSYNWKARTSAIAKYLGRKLRAKSYDDAEIISIDGIQTPQLKTKIRVTEENKNYWIEGRLNTSNKGRILVLYAGEKGRGGKAQIFANLDQEKLSFDHKDRKPEDLIAKITIQFPSGKKMGMEAPANPD